MRHSEFISDIINNNAEEEGITDKDNEMASSEKVENLHNIERGKIEDAEEEKNEEKKNQDEADPVSSGREEEETALNASEC